MPRARHCLLPRPPRALCGLILHRAEAIGGKAHADADADFRNAKRITPHPDALHLLPQAAALRDAVLHGAVSTLGLSDTQF